jgi:hypothetical protein
MGSRTAWKRPHRKDYDGLIDFFARLAGSLFFPLKGGR